MKENIRKHVNKLFEEAPRISGVMELKEEMINNLEEKYDDLINDSYSSESAYNIVIASIGNVNELIDSLYKDSVVWDENRLKARKKTALIVSISIAIYIISLILLIILEPYSDLASIITFLVTAGVATIILVYHFLSLPTHHKKDNTVAENYKEWQKSKENRKSIRSSINSIIWLITVIGYFVISFHYRNWHISWLIFIIGALAEIIVKLIYDIGDRK